MYHSSYGIDLGTDPISERAIQQASAPAAIQPLFPRCQLCRLSSPYPPLGDRGSTTHPTGIDLGAGGRAAKKRGGWIKLLLFMVGILENICKFAARFGSLNAINRESGVNPEQTRYCNSYKITDLMSLSCRAGWEDVGETG